MNSGRSAMFLFSSVLLLISGILGIIMDIIMTYMDWKKGEEPRFWIAMAAILMLIYFVISIAAALVSLANRRQRINTRKCAALGVVILVLAIAQILISGCCGIYLWQLIVLLVLGFLIPALYAISAAYSR